MIRLSSSFTFLLLLIASCTFLEHIECSSGNNGQDNTNNNNNDDDDGGRVCVVGERYDGSEVTCERMNMDDKTIIVEPLIDDDLYGLQMVHVEWGEIQKAEGTYKRDTLENIRKTYKYMTEEIYINDKYKKIRDQCLDRNELCAMWAATGECEKNPNYMTIQCSPSCQSCQQLDFEYRCPYDKNAPNIWNNGDLNQMFERIVSDPIIIEKYNPTILSRPSISSFSNESITDDNDNTNNNYDDDGPWVITLDNVISTEECNKLIELGAIRGYERSADVGTIKFDGTYNSYENNGRTSSNTWCIEECYNDITTQTILNRLETITNIPDKHSEYLQLLKYEKNQFYQQHHDYIQFHNEREHGVRILTIFLYLNNVIDGGGTHFPLLNITVEPKVGRILLWPSVLNSNPNLIDERTEHEALPVQDGIKYAANAWVHQRDFKSVYAKRCS